MSFSPASTLRAGALATVTSCLALAAVARGEGRSAAQPLNATSHWLHGDGDGAAQRREADLRHTGIGLATRAAATLFWAAFFEGWDTARPVTGKAKVVARALAVSALAAVVDYTITPKRFTPGWEYVLSKRAMGAVYVAMAAGFAGTALLRNPSVAR